MADVFVPGVKSRFDTDKMISGLMEVERIPRNRIEKEVETLKSQKDNWQNLGRRITDMRESARLLFSFQNPFNERSAVSSDDAVLSAETTRESFDQNHSFTVKQLAAADKFVSNPLPNDFMVSAGTYNFSTGKNDVSFRFGGGSIQEFTNVLNQRAEGKIAAQLIAVRPNTKSFIIESLDTGAENQLTFAADAEKFAIKTGILSSKSSGPKLINIPAVPEGSAVQDSGGLAIRQSTSGGSLTVPAMAETRVALNAGIVPTETMILRFETAVSDNAAALAADRAYAEKLAVYTQQKAAWEAARAAAGGEAAGGGAAASPASAGGEAAGEGAAAGELASAGGEAAGEGAAAGELASAGGEAAGEGAAAGELALAGGEAAGEAAAAGEGSVDVAVAGEAAGEGAAAGERVAVGFPEIEPPPPSVENLDALVLYFSDGTSAALHPVKDSQEWNMQSYQLGQIANGKTAAAISIQNGNTHRDVSIKDIQIFDPVGEVKTEPRAPIAKAQDAIIVMDGIEIERPVNKIDDLITGMTINARAVSDMPVSLGVQTDTESVKESIITLVGNYNRLMVELNILTRSDESIIRELSYLNKDEQDELRKRMGAFSGDSTLLRFKSSLQEIMTASYQTGGGERFTLNNFGITTDARRSGSYDPTKMRGYLEIDENVLNESLRSNLPKMRQVFGLDTDGDKIVDTGVGFALDRAARPYVELGGIIAMRSSGIDTRISASERRIESIDKQLEAKEASLRSQYGQMEGAYTRMERLSNSLDQFGRQNSGTK